MKINQKYAEFYAKANPTKVYPTEFVVRTFLATYPNLNFAKPQKDNKILDIGFGDARNTVFLCDQGFDVHGVEIENSIVSSAQNRLNKLGLKAELRVGRNNDLPYEDSYFDTLLACHSCYYCDEGNSIMDNLKEYARVLKPGGFLVASVPDENSYILQNSVLQKNGTRKISQDPYGNRVGYDLHAFADTEAIKKTFSNFFTNFSFGHAQNNYYGIDERVFWVVCQNHD